MHEKETLQGNNTNYFLVLETDRSSNIWIRYNFEAKLTNSLKSQHDSLEENKQPVFVTCLCSPYCTGGTSFCGVKSGHLDTVCGSSFSYRPTIKPIAHRPTIRQQTQMLGWCTRVILQGESTQLCPKTTFTHF